MPNWKKVVVSGSNADLNQVTASQLVVGTPNNQYTFPTQSGAISHTLVLNDSDELEFGDISGSLPPGTVSSSAQIAAYGDFVNIRGGNTISGSQIFQSDQIHFQADPNSDIGAVDTLLIVTGSIITTGFVGSNGSIFIGDGAVDSIGEPDTVNFIATITSSLIPTDDNLFDLGSGSSHWNTVYANNWRGTGTIEIDSPNNARLVLDRNANGDDAEIEFKTNGTTNWTIGTGQVGNDNEFTIKGGSTNFVRISESGNASFLGAVTASAFTGDGSGLTGITSDSASYVEWDNVVQKPVLYSGSAQLVDALEGQDLSLGVISASILHEIYTTQSINLGSGSFQFGDTLDDTHTFTGSVNITGSLSVIGNIDSVGRIETDDSMRSVFVGRNAGTNEQPGYFYNTGIGFATLGQVTSGLRNTGLGFQSVGFVQTGDDNIGIGYFAGLGVTTGQRNVYIGTEAGGTYSSGGGRSENTAVGYYSQQAATSAENNSTFGSLSGQSITTGGHNTLLGWRAGAALTTGTSNVAIGSNAAYQNMNGSSNIIIGYNTAVSASGDDNTIVIGAGTVGRGANTTTIGATATTSAKIYGSLEIDGITDVSASIADLESFSASLDATFATEDELNSATQSLSQSLASTIEDIVDGTITVTSSSYAITASYVQASDIVGDITASSVDWTDITNTPDGIVSGSTQITALGFLSESFSTDGTGITSGSAQIVSLLDGQDVNLGDISATSINTSIVSSSITFTSGSNIFGDELTDVHEFTGSVEVLGGITASLLGTASTGSHALIANTSSHAIFADNATSSETASYVEQSISASYVQASDIVGDIAASSVDWSDIDNRPDDIVSSSAQITAHGFISESFSTAGTGIVSGSAQIATDISGAFTEASGGFATITTDTSASLALLSSSFETLSSSLDTDFITEAELNAATQSLSSSLATDISASDARLDVFDGLGLVSGSSDTVLVNNFSASNDIWFGGNIFGDGSNLTGITSSLIQNGLLFGLGLNGGTYNGVLDVTGSLDTSSVHFLSGSVAAIEAESSISLTGSLLGTATSASYIAWDSIDATPEGIVSSSTQIVEHLPTGTITSSAQITAHGFISESFSTAGTGILSGSEQIATEISGAFTAASSSFSASIASLKTFSSSLDATFATDAEINAATQSLSSSLALSIQSNRSASDANGATIGTLLSETLLSGSVQIATEISGAFNADSASFAELISTSNADFTFFTQRYSNDTGSFITGSSVSNATLTFHKGDSTTETRTINNVVNATSASYIQASNIDGDITADSIAYSNITGTPSGIVSGSTQVVSLLDGQDVNLGNISATSINTSIVSSSITFTSGSNIFGDEASDVHEFTGSVEVLGGITASLLGTASTASYVNASNIDGDITALSASYASTASVANMLTLNDVSNTNANFVFPLIETGSMSLMSYDSFDLIFNPLDGELTATSITVTNLTISESSIGEGTIRNSVNADTASVANTAVSADTASLASGVDVIPIPAMFDTYYPVVTNVTSGGGSTLVTSSFYFNRVDNVLHASTFSGSFNGDGSGITGVSADSASYVEASVVTSVTTYRETVSGATSYVVNHNLNERYPIVQAWNTSNNQMEIPASITTNTVNQVTVDFGLPFTGRIVVKI